MNEFSVEVRLSTDGNRRAPTLDISAGSSSKSRSCKKWAQGSPRFYPPFQGYALNASKSPGCAILMTNPLLTSLLKATETNRGTMNPVGFRGDT